MTKLQASNQRKVSILPWELGLYKPYRYKILAGGRGGGKSIAVANNFVRSSFLHKGIFLCTREYQNSIKYSVHSLLKNRIEVEGLSEYFDIKENYIKNICSGNLMIFMGLQEIESIKSINNIDKLWVEEGETLSVRSWEVLKPCVRNVGSEIYCTFNPKEADGVLYKEYIANKVHDDDTYVSFINYWDNPHFPDVLRKEMENDKRRDYGKYLHIWEGQLLTNSEAQVFQNPRHWIVDDFEVDPTARKYQGLDFGFKQDPTAATQSFVRDNKLFIAYEAVKHGLEIDDIGKYCEANIPDFRKWKTYADCADPAIISYLKRQGYLIEAVKKGAGSIEAGCAYLKSYDLIVVHPRCINVARNFSYHSYKVDPRSGVISNQYLDNNNDCIDSIRYGQELEMRRSRVDYSGIKSWAMTA